MKKKVIIVNITKEVVFLIISLFIAAIAATIAIVLFYSEVENIRTSKLVRKKTNMFAIIAGVALVVRIACLFFYPGHESDMSCFYNWSEIVFKDGFKNFYTSEFFTDYPPGYMYILYVIGFIKNVFKCSPEVTYMILKLPAIICDLLCGYIVYRLAERHNNPKIQNLLTIFFLFNPAIILNSSIWGQVDSVFTLFILIMLYCLMKNKMYTAYFVFGLSLFIKPQSLFYAPVLLYGIIENVFLNNFSKEKLIKNLLLGLSAIALIFLLAAPFGIENVVMQYQSTIESYNYISVNAYNLWSALGQNWIVPNMFINAVGYIMVIAIIAASAVIFFSKKSENRYFYTSAFICFSIFMLSVRMHERYAFPAIILMLCACCISLNKTEFLLYAGLSITQLMNMVHVLFYYNPQEYFNSGTVMPLVLGWITAIFFVFFLVYTKRNFIQFKKKDHSNVAQTEKENKHISRFDIGIILAISIVYGVIALYNLGDTTAPQTYTELSPESPITLDLGQDVELTQMYVYLGPTELKEERKLNVVLTDEAGNTTYSMTTDKGNVFYWNVVPSYKVTGRYVTLSATDTVNIMELAVFNQNIIPIIPVNAPELLFDEQDTIPERISHRNCTYFDEIYHARTAYEFIHEMEVYEWTHPPLGKTLISLGIRMFDMTPFGWRIIGTLFGIFMIPVIYIFLKKLSGLTWLTVCGTLLFTFDFMHFAQTRISTIDVYVTFFIMLMYLFMYKYYTMSVTESIKKHVLYLGLSGTAMGFAIACKWTGVYAGVGLALIFFISLYHKYTENAGEFKVKITKTILFCILMFVVVPLSIYTLSYIPFMRASGTGFAGIIQNQIDMLLYHGKTVVSSTHDYSSPWYTWPINYRPIWFYGGKKGELTENISSFGNPLVWWVGILALIYCIYDAFKNKNRISLFLVIGYLAQLIPWIPVTRITFIYHYFPCVPFIVLLISHSAYRLYEKNIHTKKIFIIYTALAVLLFAMFYPVISGYPVEREYVETALRWFSSWHLTN